MSEEYSPEEGQLAPKPSAVRRSGKISYARKFRKQRSGMYSNASRRTVEKPKDAQQRNPGRSHNSEEQGDLSTKQNHTPEPLPDTAGDSTNNADRTIQPQATDKDIDGVVREAVTDEVKNLVSTEDSQAIIDNKSSEHGEALSSAPENIGDSTVAEQETLSEVSTFMSTFDDIQEENDGGEETAIDGNRKPIDDNSKPIVLNQSNTADPSARDEVEDKRSKILPVHRQPSYQRQIRARVYHRPHTNQTLVASSDNNDDNDSKSTASGLSQPSWVSRRMQREEEERDELSQTSVGNSKRRERVAKRKKREKKSGRKKYSSDESRNANTMGYVVSQAFDKMLGYAGGHHYADDGYSSDESDNIMHDLQEAILTTFGCSVPQPKPRKARVEDDTTIESNHTGRQSRQSEHSEVQHVRTGSNLSESVFSTVSGSNVESVLSFDTTEELADFSKDKKAPSTSTTSYKIPEAYDPEPPNILTQKEGDSSYSDEVYSNIRESDFEPVNLLEEGDSMLDSMGKDLINVANTTVDEVFTSIGSLLGSQQTAETDVHDTNSKPIERNANTKADELNKTADTVLITSLSNLSEPLEVIKENDGDVVDNNANHERRDLADIASDNEFVAFEDRFEINVFETVEPVTEPVDKTPISTVNTNTLSSVDQETKTTASDENLFHGIDEQKTEAKDDSDWKLLMEVTENQSNQNESDVGKIVISSKKSSDTENNLSPLKTSEDTAHKGEETSSAPSIKEETGTKITTAIVTSSLETATDPITVDRDSPRSVVLSKDNVKDALTTEKSSRPDEQTAAIPEKKPTKTSFEAATQATQIKKSKKFGGFKGLIRRSFKKKQKGSKKLNSIPLASELAELQIQDPVDIVPAQTELGENTSTSVSPPLQSTNSIANPEGRSISTPEKEEPLVDGKPTVAPDDFENEDDWVDFSNVNQSYNTDTPISRPTTPVVRDPDSALDTPKMSNLGLEDRILTRPLSGTNLADLPGIDEAKSFREDPPARKEEKTTVEVNSTQQLDRPANIAPFGNSNIPKKNDDGFDVSFDRGNVFEKQHRSLNNVETSKASDVNKEVAFENFHIDQFDVIEGEKWESFGESSDDVGAVAYRQKALEDARNSANKVSGYPLAPLLAEF